MRVFDQAFESHLDFADWRTVNLERDSRPALHLGKWRYQMKWNFKTNPEPIDALHMRMLLDCPDFDTFEQHIKDEVYPPSFTSILNDYPYGRFVGTIKDIMRVDVLQRMYRSKTLWEIWENERNPQTGALLTDPDNMARMIYAEIRTLIVCQQCGADAPAITTCQTCNGSGALVVPCELCHGKGLGTKGQPCRQCGGLGLHHRPILVAFMNRLQYIWMARNVDYLKMTYPVWLSYLTYVGIFATSGAIFVGASLLFQTPFSLDLLVDAGLFGAAALLGSLGAAIVVIFGTAFNGSGMLLASYPLRYTKFGNHIWIQLMNLIGLLTFGALLIDTTFVLSQVLFTSHINIVLLILATSVLSLFVVLFSFGGFYSIHTAMRDTKRSRLEELTEWLYQNKRAENSIDTAQEEEFFKEIRELQEWPIDMVTTLGIVSGILIPVILSLGSVLPGYLATIFRK
jgi:hypothetical protein